MTELTQLHITTATDGAGTNCKDRALAALAAFPHHRAVIGSLLLQGCQDMRTGAPVPWCKPWGHHIWLIEPDGGHYDPSACNLQHWARVQEVGLPRPWQELRAGVLDSPQLQAELVRLVMAGYPTGDGLPDAIYLPGLVYSSPLEEMPQSHAYVSAWGRLAKESVRAGGWDIEQLQQALERVDGLMAEPPRIRQFPVIPAPKKRSGRGFAREGAADAAKV